MFRSFWPADSIDVSRDNLTDKSTVLRTLFARSWFVLVRKKMSVYPIFYLNAARDGSTPSSDYTGQLSHRDSIGRRRRALLWPVAQVVDSARWRLGSVRWPDRRSPSRGSVLNVDGCTCRDRYGSVPQYVKYPTMKRTSRGPEDITAENKFRLYEIKCNFITSFISIYPSDWSRKIDNVLKGFCVFTFKQWRRTYSLSLTYVKVDFWFREGVCFTRASL